MERLERARQRRQLQGVSSTPAGVQRSERTFSMIPSTPLCLSSASNAMLSYAWALSFLPFSPSSFPAVPAAQSHSPSPIISSAECSRAIPSCKVLTNSSCRKMRWELVDESGGGGAA